LFPDTTLGGDRRIGTGLTNASTTCPCWPKTTPGPSMLQRRRVNVLPWVSVPHVF